MRDVRHNMSGCTKPIETEPLCISGLAQRAIPNQSGTQEWSRGYVVKGIRNRKTISSISNGELRVAAVDRIAGKPCQVAKVLPSHRPVLTLTQVPTQPW